MNNYRSTEIPSALSNKQGWILHTLKYNPCTKKLDKKPVHRGWQHSTDSLDLCLWKSRNNPDWKLGLSLNPEVNGMALIDFDDVGIGGGNFTAEAMGYVRKANTLSEVSASKNGIHLLITAKVDKNYRNKYQLNQGFCELYWKSRFVSLTFDWRLDAPQTIGNFESIPEILPFVYEVGRTARNQSDELGDAIGYGATPKYPIQKSTFEGLRYYLNKAKNHEKFSRLFNGAYIHDGQFLGNDDYPSQSEADLALCCLSMFYGKSEHFQKKFIENLDQYDSSRGLAYSICDKMMRRSELNRSKWRRFDYRLSTLHLAYELQTSYYFDEHFRSEFSALQRDRQWRSATKRAYNNQERIESAIDSLSQRGDKVTHSAIAKYTGLARSTVIRNMKKLKV